MELGWGLYRTWKILHNVGLRSSYSLPNVVTVIKPQRTRRAWNVAQMGQTANWYTILVVKPEGKRLWRLRREDNIKMDNNEIGYERMNWIQLSQDSY